mgnify:CR=1 FL=1
MANLVEKAQDVALLRRDLGIVVGSIRHGVDFHSQAVEEILSELSIAVGDEISVSA